jgi:hypothetical protein
MAPPIVLRRYYRQEDAVAAIPPGHFYRLWACDTVKESGSVSKFFMCCPVDEFFSFLKNHCDVYNYYEVISESSPVRFHLDVEVEIVHQSNVDLTKVSMRRLLSHLELSEHDQVRWT